MRLDFTKEQIDSELNKIEIEEDELILIGEYVQGEGKKYIITGKAIIEGETYHDFQIEFELSKETNSDNIEEIINSEWEWYDYLC